MSTTSAEGQGQQAGASALPPGVVAGSAAAQAIEAQAAAAKAQGQQQGGTDAGDDGKGGKTAVLADLAKERQQRHAAEQQVAELTKQFEQLKAGLGQALGVQGQQVTPEQLQQQAQAAQSQQQEAMTQLAVYQLASTAGADPVKLMDSASFLASLKTLQPTDHAGITAAIKTAVERNSTLAVGKVAPAGAGDAGQGSGSGGQAPSINDLIRAAAGHGGQ